MLRLCVFQLVTFINFVIFDASVFMNVSQCLLR